MRHFPWFVYTNQCVCVCVRVCYRGSPCWVGWSSQGGWSPVRQGQGPSEQSCRPDQASERHYRNSPCHPPAYVHTHTHTAMLIWTCQRGTTREAFFENIIQSWWLFAKKVENLTSSTGLQLADVIMCQHHFTKAPSALQLWSHWKMFSRSDAASSQENWFSQMTLLHLIHWNRSQPTRCVISWTI